MLGLEQVIDLQSCQESVIPLSPAASSVIDGALRQGDQSNSMSRVL
jgi:hypothetical protein